MPDIFDTVAENPKQNSGDIFDRVADVPKLASSHAPKPTLPEVSSAIASVPKPSVNMQEVPTPFQKPDTTPLAPLQMGQRFYQPTVAEQQSSGGPLAGERFVSGVGGYKKIAEGSRRFKNAISSPVDRTPLPPLQLGVGSNYGSMQPPTVPVNVPEATAGALEAAQGTMEASTPIIMAGGIVNPVSTAKGLTEAYAASKIAGYGAKKAGFSPEAQELAATVAPLAVGGRKIIKGIVNPELELVNTPEVKGGMGSIFGGSVRGGVAVTPEEIKVAGGIGSKQGGFSIPRKSAPVQPALEPPTIQGNAPTEPVASAPEPNAVSVVRQSDLNDATALMTRSLQQDGTLPTPQAPQPVKHPPVNDKNLTQAADDIASLPKEQKEPAILKAHEELTQALTDQGKAVIDGKLVVVDSPQTASKVAAEVVNEGIKRTEKFTDKPKSTPTVNKTEETQTVPNPSTPTASTEESVQFKPGDSVSFTDSKGVSGEGVVEKAFGKRLSIRTADGKSKFINQENVKPVQQSAVSMKPEQAGEVNRGTVRLYRGGAVPGSGAGVPEWVKSDPKFLKSKDAEGRWFTSDLAEAQKYAEEAGTGRVTYVDVPAEVAEQFRAANNPEASKFVHHTKQGILNDEHFLPREISNTAKPLEQSSPSTPPSTAGKEVESAENPSPSLNNAHPEQEIGKTVTAGERGREAVEPKKNRIQIAREKKAARLAKESPSPTVESQPEASAPKEEGKQETPHLDHVEKLLRDITYDTNGEKHREITKNLSQDEAEILRRRFDRNSDAYKHLTSRASQGPRTLEERVANNPNVAKVEPSKDVPKEGRNFEGRYVKAALEEAKANPPDAESVFIKVPGDGKFVIPNKPEAIDRAIKATGKFVPSKERESKPFKMQDPTTAERLGYIKRLQDEIDQAHLNGKDSVDVEANRETIKEIKRLIEEDEGKNPLRKVGEKFAYTYPKSSGLKDETTHIAVQTELPGIIAVQRDGYKSKSFDLTHEATGKKVGSGFRNLDDANKAIAALSEMGVDWTTKSESELTSAFKKLPEGVRNALRTVMNPVPSSYIPGRESSYRLDEGLEQLKKAKATAEKLGLGKGREKKAKSSTPEANALTDSTRVVPGARSAATGDETKGGPVLRSSLFGVDIAAEKGYEAAKSFYEHDLAPSLSKAGTGLHQTAQLFTKIFYPRIEDTSIIGKALGVGAPKEAVDAMMKMKGERDQELANYRLAMDGVGKYFDKLPDEGRIDFIDRIQTGQKQSTPELQQLADAFSKILAEQRAQEVEAANLGRSDKDKVTLPMKPNYFPNLGNWEVRPGGEPVLTEAERVKSIFQSRRPLEGTKGYNKQQSYTLKSGMEAGGKPFTTNPVRILENRIQDGMKFVTARRMEYELKQLGLMKFAKASERTPDGWDDLNDRIAKVYFQSASGEGRIEAGRWIVEGNSARLLNNFLSRDYIREHAVGNALMGLKNASTAIELGLSPFHAVFETVEAMSSQMSLGFLRLYNEGVRNFDSGKMLEGLKDIAASPVSPVTLARDGSALSAYVQMKAKIAKLGGAANSVEGKKLLGEWREMRKMKAIQKLQQAYPDLDRMVDDMFAGGLQMEQHRDYQTQTMQTVREALSKGNVIGATLRALPAANQTLMKPLFQMYIPALKTGLFLRQYSQQLSELSPELESGQMTREQVARKVVDSVENRFGELNFDNLFWHRTWKTALQFMFRSVTWKLGNVREFSGAIGGQARELGKWAYDAYQKSKGNPDVKVNPLPKLDPKMAWVASLMLTTATLGTVASKALNGKYPWQYLDDKDRDEEGTGGYAAALYRETVHPWTGEYDGRGNKIRISLPTYWKDVEHLQKKGPGAAVVSSLSGVLSKGIDVAQNDDYFGNYVYNPNATRTTKAKQIAKYMFPTPFVASSYQRAAQMGDKKTAILGSFGFPKAPSDIDFTPAESMALEFVRAREPRKTPEELEDWNNYNERKQSGDLTPRERKMERAKERKTFMERTFSRLTYSEAKEVMKVASPQEQRDLSLAMRKKRLNLLRRGERDKVNQIDAQ